ncbi:MAG: DUF6544 family protein [Bacteroidota bacterium]
MRTAPLSRPASVLRKADRRRPILWTSVAAASLVAVGAAAWRGYDAYRQHALEAALLALPPAGVFSEARLEGLPALAQRYLRHAIAPGIPLAPAGRLTMRGTMTPSPGAEAVAFTADEVLAPRRGFVWTAHARMQGLPVRVRDHYVDGDGGLHVAALGIVPLPVGGDGPDVTRSARGRLVAEAVWCPTALVHPSVQWEAVDDERVRYTVPVDGEAVTVTLRLSPDGAPREVTMQRWGDVDGPPWRSLPYGFAVEAERTFAGVTIPTRLTGGWHYGTPQFDPATAATFVVEHAALDLAP